MLSVLDLFSGIGGFSLGLERTGGFKTVAFCEIDPKARLVLKHHWPEVPIHNDVREITKESLGPVDVICGGFPCQDISVAGKGVGLSGERSGLWYEMLRIVNETKPKWAIIENVAALRNRGLDKCLSGLAEVGYDAEWYVIPASAVGAPHQRNRIWIMAYPESQQDWGLQQPWFRTDVGDSSYPVADATGKRLEAGWSPPRLRSEGFTASCWWEVEPEVGRVANGFPGRVDRLKQLGNAVVPQIPELIGRAILKAEEQCVSSGISKRAVHVT